MKVEICPKCKFTPTKLISITDDGKGEKYCKDCKKLLKEKHPNRNYRTKRKYNNSIKREKK